MKSDIKEILREPWIDLNFKKTTKKQEIEYNQTFRQKEKYLFLQKAFDFIYGNQINGSFFEFGCHKARTFRFALRESIIKNMQMEFYAFDSFQGLPDHKNNKSQSPWYLKGFLKTELNNFEKLISKYRKYRKINIIKGFYKDSLNLKLKNSLKKKNTQVSFINLDCDLMKSVSESLNFSLDFIVNGSVLYVDDYYSTFKGDPRKGIPKTVLYTLKKKRIYYEPWHSVGSFGKSFLLYKK